jgi:hypothetical protein
MMDRRKFLEAAGAVGGAVLPNASTAAGGPVDLRKPSAPS